MYADFLTESKEYIPDIESLGLIDKMHSCANLWTELAEAFKLASNNSLDDLSQVTTVLGRVLDAEEDYCLSAVKL